MKEAGNCILRAINLNKRFGGLSAVDNVSFGIDALGVTSIIGPNGAGKSTLFNLLSGSFLPALINAHRCAVGDVFRTSGFQSRQAPDFLHPERVAKPLRRLV